MAVRLAGMRVAAALLFVGAVAAGCRATPAVASDDLGADLGVAGDDLGDVDLGADDLAVCPSGAEVCNDGCDNDRNGYIDADDPACTSQMLVTFSITTPQLWRLILEPTPHIAILDGNPVQNGGMATLASSFAPAAFIAFDSSTKVLRKVPLGGTPASTSTSFTTRDVCVFNGELIVVEPLGTSKLHRFQPDGKTEIMTPVPVAGIASACASDGNMLYVARRPLATSPSEIAVFGPSTSGPVDTGTVIALPDALDSNYDRLVDFAYVKKSGVFIGLFAHSGGSPDSQLDGQVMATFGLDGGLGPFIDGGVWHGVGEFLP